MLLKNYLYDTIKNDRYDILRNERYKGTYVFNKAKKRRKDGSRAGHGGQKPESEIIRIPNGIPAIVDEVLWQRVNERLDRRRRAGSSDRAKESYLLSGLIVAENVATLCLVTAASLLLVEIKSLPIDVISKITIAAVKATK